MRKTTILIFLLSGLFFASANNLETGFTNDICMPSKIYTFSDVKNSFFAEPIVKRWRPYSDIIRFDGNIKYSEKMERFASFEKIKDGSIMKVSLVNTNKFETIKETKTIIHVGEKSVGRGEVVVQILGDSYVNGTFFKDALLTQTYVPNIKLIGLRKIKGENEQYDEGRGGWKLEDYFKIPIGEYSSYHGFMQPEGDCRYWGATAFWKRCFRVGKGELTDFGSTYHCSRFDDYLYLFDEKTGYILTPKKNDIQFDNQLNLFMRYDGEKWLKVAESDYNWIFDYGKYLTMWNLPAPHFFFEMLGLNDFRYHVHNNFAVWNERIEIMKKSYLKAVPSGKFVVLIPASTCGTLNNSTGDFTIQQNASMWECRKNIIDVFDNRENEAYYVVDVGITIDNLNGYNTNAAGVQTGNPHPYPNYPAMGISLAAFIQYHRAK